MKQKIIIIVIILLGVINSTMLFAQNDWSAVQGIVSKYNGVCTAPPSVIVTNQYTQAQVVGNGDIGVVIGNTTSQQTFRIGKNDFWGACVKDPGAASTSSKSQVWQQGCLSGGVLNISCPTASTNPGPVYHMNQDIANAEVTTQMQFGSSTVKMISWTAESDNIFVTELQNTDMKDITIKLDISVPNQYKYQNAMHDCNTIYPYFTGVNNGVIWSGRQNYIRNTDDDTYDVTPTNLMPIPAYRARIVFATKVIGATIANTTSGKSNSNGTFVLKAGATVQVVVVVKSDVGIEGVSTIKSVTTLADEAIQKVNSLTNGDIASLKTEHQNWWRDYWTQSFVKINDNVVEGYYYGSLYVLGCNYRGNKIVPPGLWGVWSVTDTPNWGGRYTLNYNSEAPLYGVFSSNRPELANPYINMILAELPFERNWTHMAGWKGAEYRRSLHPYNTFNAVPSQVAIASKKNNGDLPAWDQKSNGSFAAMVLIWYYEYTKDANYMRNKLYPFLKELDMFWRDYMTKKDLGGGKYVYIIEHSSCHEGSNDLNPNSDLGFWKKILRTLIEGSKVLNTDASMVPVWQDILDNLADYPTTTYNGVTVFAEAENKNGNTDPANLLHLQDQPVGMEGSVFPGENVYVGGDPAKIKIAQNTLQQQGGWAIAGHSNDNGFPKVWPIASRAGWPAKDLMARLQTAISNHWRSSNLTVGEGGGGIETVGAIEGVNSMLMQSEGGIIRVFPVWPTSVDASFVRLRAKGARLISSSIKGGKIQPVTITSLLDDKIVVLNPWVAKPFVAEVSSSGAFIANVVFTYDATAKTITFTSQAGKNYTISDLDMSNGNAAPSVSITSPANNATFTAPASITISANASDSDGSVAKVDFYNGSTLLGSDNTSPYSFAWNNVAAGTYSITANATDDKGAVTTSAVVNVTVNTVTTNQAPIVSIGTPVNNAAFTVGTTVYVNANASDPDGSIAKIDLYYGTTFVATEKIAPYEWNITGLVAGTYVLKAIATDNGGAQTTSALVTIVVNASTTNAPPTVSITSPANNASFNAPASITINANASDSDGSVTKVDFYNGTTLLGSDASSPYSFGWNNVAAGTYSITAKATDDKGSVTTSSMITIKVNMVVTNTCTGIPQYVENGNYVDGSKVQNAGGIYQCKPYPYTGWCNGAAWSYAPGTGSYWTDCWDKIGTCNTARATASATNTDVQVIEIYPNPTENTSVIKLNVTDVDNAEVTVMNSLGFVVYKTTLNNQEAKIDLSGMKNGIYMIQIKSNERVWFEKLVKE